MFDIIEYYINNVDCDCTFCGTPIHSLFFRSNKILFDTVFIAEHYHLTIYDIYNIIHFYYHGNIKSSMISIALMEFARISCRYLFDYVKNSRKANIVFNNYYQINYIQFKDNIITLNHNEGNYIKNNSIKLNNNKTSTLCYFTNVSSESSKHINNIRILINDYYKLKVIGKDSKPIFINTAIWLNECDYYKLLYKYKNIMKDEFIIFDDITQDIVNIIESYYTHGTALYYDYYNYIKELYIILDKYQFETFKIYLENEYDYVGSSHEFINYDDN